MASINKLIDKNGDQFFPITHISAVIGSDGETLTADLANKQDTLVSGDSIKTINNQSLLGAGNLTISNGVDGKSAYQLWLDEGNTGTVQDFLDSLQGNPASTQDYPFQLENSLNGGVDKALTAEQGKVLDGKITALKDSIVFLTEEEYENLANPDPTKIYMTYES